MAINLLSEVKTGRRHWTVQVYVSRLWQHRGGTDDDPIRHTDLVFEDTQGNHMYGEIAENLVDLFMDRIQEGKVYTVSRFLVGTEKRNYRPVQGEFIIRFGRYTTLQEVRDNIMDFPLCTYNLTPLHQLPAPVDHPIYFTDVVGVITGISSISQYHNATRVKPSTKRVIYLSDLSGFQISLVLWGERALSFDGEGVLKTASTRPVAAIFVGTLVKPFEGRRGLSGGAACHWYINEDLHEINEIHARLKDKIPALQGITLQGQTAAEIDAQVNLETKTVKELANLKIWDHEESKFYCTVTMTKLSPGQRWWFHACPGCGKGTMPFGSAYKCPDKDCGGVEGTARYRLCYIGSDETDEIEFIFFEKAGKELIGKTTLTLLRSRAPRGVSVNDAIELGRTDQTIPRELAAVVSRKFRLVVSVTHRSFEPDAPEKPTYQVVRIDEQYGKQTLSSTVHIAPGLALDPSTSSSSGGLSLLGRALADDLEADEVAPPGATPAPSDPYASTDTAVSSVGTRVALHQTPPSVVKPPALSTDKEAVSTSAKRALFNESSPPSESESQLDSGLGTPIGLSLVSDSPIGLALVGDPSHSPVAVVSPSAVVDPRLKAKDASDLKSRKKKKPN